jgi:hypothetical protein
MCADVVDRDGDPRLVQARDDARNPRGPLPSQLSEPGRERRLPRIDEVREQVDLTSAVPRRDLDAGDDLDPERAPAVLGLGKTLGRVVVGQRERCEAGLEGRLGDAPGRVRSVRDVRMSMEVGAAQDALRSWAPS